MAMAPVFLVALSLLLVTARGAQIQGDASAVLDTDGNSVVEGAQYYILPASRISLNGGMYSSPLNNDSCPTYVAQHHRQSNYGEPVMFFPQLSSDDGVVFNGHLVYFMFSRPSECSKSSVWQVSNQGYVTTGGTVSKNDPHRSRFAIYKSGRSAYTIQSCPCLYCRMGCANVGVSTGSNGKRLLNTFSNSAYEVKFQRLDTCNPSVLRE